MAPECFEYGPEEDSERLRHLANKIQTHARRTTVLAVEMGKALKEAKGKLIHGRYLGWLEIECRLDPRTAQNLIRLADFAQRWGDRVYLIPASAVYELAKSSVPEKLVQYVLSAAEQGDAITVALVNTLIRAARDDASKPVGMDDDGTAGEMAHFVVRALQAQPQPTVKLHRFLKNAKAANRKIFLAKIVKGLEEENRREAARRPLMLSYFPAS